MNHRVHLFIRGCLTLKLSGSWKTVICSSAAYCFFSPLVPLTPLTSSDGDMGMVSRGTGELEEPLECAWALILGRCMRY